MLEDILERVFQMLRPVTGLIRNPQLIIVQPMMWRRV